MPVQVILTEVNEVLWWRRSKFGEKLGMDMTADLLDPYLVETCI